MSNETSAVEHPDPGKCPHDESCMDTDETDEPAMDNIVKFIDARKLTLTKDVNNMNDSMKKLLTEVEILKTTTDATQSDSDSLVVQMSTMSNHMEKLRDSLEKIFVLHSALSPTDVASLVKLMQTLEGSNYKMRQVRMWRSNTAMRELGKKVDSLTCSMELAQRETVKLEKVASTIIRQMDSIQRSHEAILSIHIMPPSDLLKRLADSMDLLKTTSREASKQMLWVHEMASKLTTEVVGLGKSSENVHNGMVALGSDVKNILEQVGFAQKTVDVLLASAFTAMAQDPWPVL